MMLLHPEVPSCRECQTWLHDGDWKVVRRGGEPLPRPKGCASPCWKCPKSQDGKPHPGAELSDRNWRALQTYYSIKAGMPMPNDSIVQWYCGVIRWAEDRIAEQQSSAPLSVLGMVLGSKGK